MAYSFISNKKNGTFTIHVTSNSSVIVAGNTSNSNAAVSDEELTGAHIKKIVWGSDGVGHIQVLRGSNTAAILNDSGEVDFTRSGGSVNVDPTATIDVNFVGSVNAYCVIECSKIGGGSSEYLVG